MCTAMDLWKCRIKIISARKKEAEAMRLVRIFFHTRRERKYWNLADLSGVSLIYNQLTLATFGNCSCQHLHRLHMAICTHTYRSFGTGCPPPSRLLRPPDPFKRPSAELLAQRGKSRWRRISSLCRSRIAPTLVHTPHVELIRTSNALYPILYTNHSHIHRLAFLSL